MYALIFLSVNSVDGGEKLDGERRPLAWAGWMKRDIRKGARRYSDGAEAVLARLFNEYRQRLLLGTLIITCARCEAKSEGKDFNDQFFPDGRRYVEIGKPHPQINTLVRSLTLLSPTS